MKAFAVLGGSVVISTDRGSALRALFLRGNDEHLLEEIEGGFEVYDRNDPSGRKTRKVTADDFTDGTFIQAE